MNPPPHILVVDDDRDICLLLSKYMTQHGYRVSTARDGKAMMQTLETARISLVILDLMLPGEDGLALCRRLRDHLPIIMLTAMNEDADRILGLEMGADDYLTKPFNPRELLARVRAVLRRTGAANSVIMPAAGQLFEFGGWRLDVGRRQLFSPADVLVPLRAGEFDLLLAFAERPQRVLSREQLLDLARGRMADSFDRSIDVQICRLRRKIEVDPKKPEIIKTVRAGGYIFSIAVTVTEGEHS